MFQLVSDVVSMETSAPVRRCIRVKILSASPTSSSCPTIAVAADETGTINIDVREECEGKGKIVEGKAVVITKGYWSSQRKLFTLNKVSMVSSYFLPMEIPQAIMDEAPKAMDIAKVFAGESVPVAESLSLSGRKLSIAGKVMMIGETIEFTTQKGRDGRVRNVHIKDESGRVRVGLFGVKGDIPLKTGDYVSISGLTVAEMHEGKTLASSDMTEIEVVAWTRELISSDSDQDKERYRSSSTTVKIMGFGSVVWPACPKPSCNRKRLEPKIDTKTGKDSYKCPTCKSYASPGIPILGVRCVLGAQIGKSYLNLTCFAEDIGKLIHISNEDSAECIERKLEEFICSDVTNIRGYVRKDVLKVLTVKRRIAD